MLQLHQLFEKVLLQERLSDLEVKGRMGDMQFVREVGSAGLGCKQNPKAGVNLQDVFVVLHDACVASYSCLTAQDFICEGIDISLNEQHQNVALPDCRLYIFGGGKEAFFSDDHPPSRVVCALTVDCLVEPA